MNHGCLLSRQARCKALSLARRKRATAERCLETRSELDFRNPAGFSRRMSWFRGVGGSLEAHSLAVFLWDSAAAGPILR